MSALSSSAHTSRFNFATASVSNRTAPMNSSSISLVFGSIGFSLECDWQFEQFDYILHSAQLLPCQTHSNASLCTVDLLVCNSLGSYCKEQPLEFQYLLDRKSVV